MFRQLRQALSLATKDYLYEWQMSICFVLALAAVLGPMLVLFGLKFGIVGSMVSALIEDPRNREIRPVSSGHYDRSWIDAIGKRKDVAFVVPKTRSIAATIQLSSDRSSHIIPVEVIPSGHDDPLLAAEGPIAEDLDKIIVSKSVAEKLGIGAGDALDGSLSRRFKGQKERVHLPLIAVAVAPASAFSRDGIFASVNLVEALEDFRDGLAVPAAGWSGNTRADERTYPGFRLYARSIYDVADLRDNFSHNGIDVATKAADIEMVQRMDNTLAGIYWAIAIIGLTGFSLSLGASLWANVDRKRKELSVLRLVGFRTGHITWFPVLQAVYTATLGWLLACGIYYGAALAINKMLAPQLNSGQTVCNLLPEHYLLALALTVAASVLAAGMAGIRATRIEPSEGLREI